ncbi:MAG: hypothetical protein R3C19_25990 [Planctomycetaceae bacterium]
MVQAARIVEHQIRLNMAEMTRIDGELMQKHLPAQRRAELTERLKVVKAATTGWQNKYFALTGVRWTSVDMAPLHVRVNGQEVYEQEQARKYREMRKRVDPTILKQMIEQYQGRIQEVDLKLFRIKGYVNEETRWPEATFKDVMREVGKGLSENFVLLERHIPWDLKNNTIPSIEADLAAARSALAIDKTTGNFRETHRNLVRAADKVNLALDAIERHRSAMQKGGKAAIAYIKWGSIIVTMPVTAAAGGGMAAVGMAMSSKFGEEGGTLLARHLGGEKLTPEDYRKALGEIALAGGTAAIGEIAQAFAPQVASRVYRTASPSKAQVELVAEKLSTVVANNFEQAMKAVGNMMEGKPVKWDWWASAVSPMIPNKALSDAVKEESIREGVAAQR